jgi:hypothetical protein
VLHAACLGQNGKVDVPLVILLLEHGASYTVHNAKGFSPIDKALRGIDTKFTNELFKQLFEAKVPPQDKHQLWYKLMIHHTFDPSDVTITFSVSPIFCIFFCQLIIKHFFLKPCFISLEKFNQLYCIL